MYHKWRLLTFPSLLRLLAYYYYINLGSLIFLGYYIFNIIVPDLLHWPTSFLVSYKTLLYDTLFSSFSVKMFQHSRTKNIYIKCVSTIFVFGIVHLWELKKCPVITTVSREWRKPKVPNPRSRKFLGKCNTPNSKNIQNVLLDKIYQWATFSPG